MKMDFEKFILTNALLRKGKQVRGESFLYSKFLAYRWSPREFADEPLAEEEMLPLFEAARWAPSSYNEQEWRYVYALKGQPEFNEFLLFLVDQNQSWAKNSGCLTVLIGKKTFTHNGNPNKSFQLDCGISLGFLLCESALRGLAVHPMAGFYRDRIVEYLGLSEDYEPLCCIAIGKYKGSNEEVSMRKQYEEVILQ
ncbi:MAG: nitroreductase family protein, partial [Deltaproteobacteria bacterium]|nr:nitroreductase family protein [Deltaproteobacteria bacterium]